MEPDHPVHPLAGRGVRHPARPRRAARRRCGPSRCAGRGSQPLDEGGWPTVSASAVAFDGLREPIALDEAGVLGRHRGLPPGGPSCRRAPGSTSSRSTRRTGTSCTSSSRRCRTVARIDGAASLENRARLLLELVRTVRAEIGERMPLFVRFSATDWTEGGWDEAQTATVARWAEDAGADFFDVSTGGLVHAPIPVGPGYQAHLAEYVGDRAEVRVSAVGRITMPEQAERLVEAGEVDAVMFGKAMMRDPHFALRAAHQLGAGHLDVAAAVPAGSARVQRRRVVTSGIRPFPMRPARIRIAISIMLR